MKAACFPYFLFYLVVFSAGLSAQKTGIIKVKKDQAPLYFFQKGIRTDSILNHSFFYLIVPDSLKRDISVYSNNGQLVRTNNDSLLQFNYLPGLRYELFYSPNEAGKVSARSSHEKKPLLELTTLVNGTVDAQSGEIFIQIVNKPADRILVENTFYLKK